MTAVTRPEVTYWSLSQEETHGSAGRFDSSWKNRENLKHWSVKVRTTHGKKISLWDCRSCPVDRETSKTTKCGEASDGREDEE